jgi:thiamine-monophosphate kinase
MDLTGGGELAAISRLERLLPAAPPGETWFGDDAAVLPGGALLAIDSVVRGVHFTDDIEGAGWRVVVRNVSDIAAMGGEPRQLVIAVTGSVDIDVLYKGVVAAAAEYGCDVVGGDLSSAGPGDGLVVTAAITGHVDGPPVLRSGARPGQVIYVSGALGAAAASGYTARPVARVAAGRAARLAGATAMIDCSDGLGIDLRRLALASGVGVRLEEIPVAQGATEAQAMGGGDDYELIFTAPADAPVAGVRIGVCTDDPTRLPDATGWEHRS